MGVFGGTVASYGDQGVLTQGSQVVTLARVQAGREVDYTDPNKISKVLLMTFRDGEGVGVHQKLYLPPVVDGKFAYTKGKFWSILGSIVGKTITEKDVQDTFSIDFGEGYDTIDDLEGLPMIFTKGVALPDIKTLMLCGINLASGECSVLANIDMAKSKATGREYSRITSFMPVPDLLKPPKGKKPLTSTEIADNSPW